MIKEEKISRDVVWGVVKKVTTNYENGERFYNIDGEDYICISETETQIDNRRTVRDIYLRKIIPIETINVEAKIS